ncbi:MAG: spore germination protein [Deltaproteobacteria bacterium]
MKIFKKISKNFINKQKSINIEKKPYHDCSKLPSQFIKRNIFSDVDENLDFIRNLVGNGMGLVTGNFDVLKGRLQVGIIYIESLSDKLSINQNIIRPLLEDNISIQNNYDDTLEIFKTQVIFNAEIKESNQMEEIVSKLLLGNTILFLNKKDTALIIGSTKLEKRAVEKPENEIAVFGSKEAFIEDIEVNCSMIIKRLPIPDLRFAEFTVGRLSHTKTRLIWIEGIANLKIIDEVSKRIKKIDIDVVEGIPELGEIIEESPLSLFPKYRQTERPDMSARYLSEGRFAIVSSNSPFALLGPLTLWDNFKTMDDYLEGPVASSFLRIIRYIAFIISLTISPLYLSFVTYNHSITPPSLAMNIASGRGGVPFPTIIELLIMNIAIDIIREAGVRLPGLVGYALGTLGAVVIGQAAVNSGFVSPSVIIVVAIAAIAVFAISTTTMVNTARILNYLFILFAGVFGMFGLISASVIMLWHLVSLESFGVPYLYPVVPFELEGWKDTFIRAQFESLKKRWTIFSPVNRKRIGESGIKFNSKKNTRK